METTKNSHILFLDYLLNRITRPGFFIVVNTLRSQHWHGHESDHAETEEEKEIMQHFPPLLPHFGCSIPQDIHVNFHHFWLALLYITLP